jgi:CheY-like chemotaxis protein
MPRILLVEDNTGDVLLFRRTLERLALDVELTVVGSAEAALDRLQAPADERPDLILTDLNLPGLRGIDLLRVVKEDPRFRRVPCIVFSSSDSMEDITAAYDAHANGYLSKSTSIEAYEQGVRALADYWFNLMQASDPDAAPPRFSPEDDRRDLHLVRRVVS